MGFLFIFPLLIVILAVLASCIRIVPQAQALVVERLGAYLDTWSVGVHFLVPFVDRVAKKVSLKEQVVDFDPQLVLLDIVLPFFNGFHWCQEIRKISKVPIIFLSSANDNMNIVMAMNMGGDEFIEKPFDLNVVTAKVQAVLRRTYEFRGTADIMEWNGAILNLADATVLYQDQKQELTKNEFKILQMLLENTGKIVSRESIMTRLWDSNEFIDDNTLTVNVARLRKKMEQIGLGGKIITKKGIGYMVEA